MDTLSGLSSFASNAANAAKSAASASSSLASNAAKSAAAASSQFAANASSVAKLPTFGAAPAAKLDRESIGTGRGSSSSASTNANGPDNGTGFSWGGFWGGKAQTDLESGQPLPPQSTDSESEAAWFKGLSKSDRFKYFVVLILLSVLFFAMAVFFFPLLVLAPSKFALSFTVGSLMFMSSFAMLRGPTEHVRSLLQRERMLFTTGYLGSMLATIYACVIKKSYLMVIIFSATQVL